HLEGRIAARYRDVNLLAVVDVGDLRRAEVHRRHVEADRVEDERLGLRVHPAQTQRRLATDAVLGDVEIEVEGQVLDRKWPVALELAGGLGKGKRSCCGLGGVGQRARAAR